jgi:hypothetical protein
MKQMAHVNIVRLLNCDRVSTLASTVSPQFRSSRRFNRAGPRAVLSEATNMSMLGHPRAQAFHFFDVRGAARRFPQPAICGAPDARRPGVAALERRAREEA